MGSVILDLSVSLDGYIVAAGQSEQAPLGHGGERLHDWAFAGDEANGDLMRRLRTSLGVVITGRTNYDLAVAAWGPDGPTGQARTPVVVLTHRPPSGAPEGGVYTFVSGGPREALRAAWSVGGERDIVVMGGADVARQFLAAGLVDEISLHVAPMLFGDGLRLFEHLPLRADLTLVDCLATDAAVHLRYRVDGPSERPAV